MRYSSDRWECDCNGDTEELLAGARAAHTNDLEYLRVAVRGLRRKLEAEPGAAALLRAEPEVGYRLVG